jgi:ribonucleoside-triphosphate reductase
MTTEKKRTRCQIYSRVVGFLTPISQWNKGKREEFKDRKTFDPEKCPEKLEPKKELGTGERKPRKEAPAWGMTTSRSS